MHLWHEIEKYGVGGTELVEIWKGFRLTACPTGRMISENSPSDQVPENRGQPWLTTVKHWLKSPRVNMMLEA